MSATNLFHPFTTATQGLFLSLEGIEGSGKTTQINAVKIYLEQQGYNTLTLREPGGTAFGERLREAILGSRGDLDPAAETFLFLSSRAQLLCERILPFLDGQKKAVILDRYIDSTLAYQGFARSRKIDDLLKLHQVAPLNILPHRTYLLDIDAQKSLERQQQRGGSKDYFESKALNFHEELVKGYRTLATQHRDRICLIQADQATQQVTEAIIADLQKLVK